VLATDGLFDNLFDEEIINIVKQTSGSADSIDTNKVAESMKSKNFAEVIAAAAQLKAHKASGVSTPFAQNARAAGYRFSGGKLDGIYFFLITLILQI
jgi:hypothetical protein